ncbi:hypothetical protein ACI65C_004481 [Semiaphis heraclei]
MTRRKKNEEISEGWERRLIEIENQLKEQTNKIEKHKEEIQKVKKEHKEEIQNLKVQWEEIHSQKIRETEEKYKTMIEKMENRYIVTFRNLGDNYQQNSSGQKQEPYLIKDSEVIHYNYISPHHTIFRSKICPSLAIKQQKSISKKP